MTDRAEQDRRTGFGRWIRRVVDPPVDYVFWRLDLRSPDGRPSYTKVFGAASFGFGVALLFRLWTYFLGQPGGLAATPTGVLAFLLGFSFLVFALPYGLRGLTLWAATRAGGTAAALRTAAEAEPERLRAQADLERARAEIAARRAAGGDDYEATAL